MSEKIVRELQEMADHAADFSSQMELRENKENELIRPVYDTYQTCTNSDPKLSTVTFDDFKEYCTGNPLPKQDVCDLINQALRENRELLVQYVKMSSKLGNDIDTLKLIWESYTDDEEPEDEEIRYMFGLDD